MADNVGITPGSGATAAADDIGGVLFQRVKVVHGADGVNDGDVAASNPLPVYNRDNAATTSFGPITAANTALFSALEMSNEQSVVLQLTDNFSGAIYLQQSNDNVTWWDANGSTQSNQTVLTNAVYAPDVVTVHVAARYFRAITSQNFNGSVSGTYVARSISPPQTQQDVRLVELATDIQMPMAGRTRDGHLTGLRTSPLGGLMPADYEPITANFDRRSAAILVETTGYNSISVQFVDGQPAFSGTIAFQVSNDGGNWNSVGGWVANGSAASLTQTNSANNTWLFPAVGRFFRAIVTNWISGRALAVAALRNQNAFQPQATPNVAVQSTPANMTVDIARVGGSTQTGSTLTVSGGGLEDSPTSFAPIICGGVARTALPASTIIAGDAVRQTFSVSGQLITKQNAPADLDFFANATVTTATQTQLRAAQAAGIRSNLTAVTYQNTNATATTLTIQDGSTTLVTFSVPASMTEPRQLMFPTPLRGTAATALNYLAGTAGANILLNVTGFSSY